jgi:hypothetical protein
MPDPAIPPPPLTPPGLTPALRLEVEVGPPQELGLIDGWRRRIIPILGGRVSGRVAGEVLPGGADWQGVRPSDGLTRLHARYWLKLDDDTLVSVSNVGVRRAPPDVSARLLGGEPVSPSSYYFRTAPTFEVAPGPHGWLAESVFVAIAEREPAFVVISVFEVS